VRIEKQVARGPALGTLFGLILLLGVALAAFWLHLGLPQPNCQFRGWTGLPCPTCGTTRMAEAVFDGDVLGALSWNPMVFLGLLGVAAWAVWVTGRRVLGLSDVRIILDASERRIVRFTAVIALLSAWAYLIARGI